MGYLQQSGDHIRDRSTTEEPNEQYSLIIIESFSVGEFEKAIDNQSMGEEKEEEEEEEKVAFLI